MEIDAPPKRSRPSDAELVEMFYYLPKSPEMRAVIREHTHTILEIQSEAVAILHDANGAMSMHEACHEACRKRDPSYPRES